MIERKVKVGFIGRIFLDLSTMLFSLAIGIWDFVVKKYASSGFYDHTDYDPCTHEFTFSKLEES